MENKYEDVKKFLEAAQAAAQEDKTVPFTCPLCGCAEALVLKSGRRLMAECKQCGTSLAY